MGAFGLKGQVKVEPLTEFESRFKVGSRLRLQGRWAEIETSVQHKGRPLLKLSGIDDPEAAKAIQWEYLEAAGSPELSEDQYLTDRLVGLSVFSDEGIALGQVDEVRAYPAQDVLLIGDLMVPMVKEFVKEVDLEGGRITVHLIPGMRE